MDDLAKTKTAGELKKQFSPIKNTNVVHRQHLSPLDKLAILATEKEIETTLFHLENQQKMMLEILARIEKLEVSKTSSSERREK